MIETNFKHTDIGLIPHDWEVKSLDSLFAFYAGGDIQKEYFSMTPQENKRYPIYSNSLENKGLYGYTSHPRYEANSITITGRGSLGHAEFRNHKFDAIVRLLVLQPKELVSGEFVTNTINFYMPFVFESTGVPQLTVPQTAKALIPLPPTLAEQEKIANALSKIDQLINDLGALIEKKKAIKQGTMQDLLTAKRRLKGFTGEWRDKKLDEMGFLTAGGTPSTIEPSYWGGDINWLQSGAVQNCIITPDAVVKTISKEGLQNSATYLIKPDSVLIAITGATCANVGYLTFESAANQSVVSIEPNKENCAMFLFQKLLTERTNILSNKGGSAQSGVTLKALKQLTITIPPTIAEQRAIAAVLSGMDTEIAALEQKRNKYIAIKQGMMQNLLTGKIRLI